MQTPTLLAAPSSCSCFFCSATDAFRLFDEALVYGLLQTEKYARALLGVDHPSKVDEMVAARLDRQRILKDPPASWVVLSEAALLQEVGLRGVMRAQLAQPLDFRDDPWVQIQVLPFSVGQHTGMMGSFNLLRFEDDPDLFYVESYDQGHMTANPQVIKERSVGYARLQATALSPEGSATLIARVVTPPPPWTGWLLAMPGWRCDGPARPVER